MSRRSTAFFKTLTALTVLVLLALIWQPIIEPWALTLIRSAR